MEAIRHAQAARDWVLAARLLADHWPGLYLGGQEATVHALMAGFPARASAADAELAAVAAADELARGSLEEAERYLGLAERGSASVPEDRRGQAQVLLGVVQLLLARRHGNLPAVAEQAQWLQALAEAPDAAQYDVAPAARAAWAMSCARLRWSKSATARPGQAGSTRPSRTWTKGSRWRAGSGGPISSSWAWCTGRRSSSTGPFSTGGGARQAGDRPGRAARLD